MNALASRGTVRNLKTVIAAPINGNRQGLQGSLAFHRFLKVPLFLKSVDRFQKMWHIQQMMKEQELLEQGSEELKLVLGRVPSLAGIAPHLTSTVWAGSDTGIDLLFELEMPEGPVRLAVEVKANGQPRHVQSAIHSLSYYVHRAGPAYPVLIAPYLSEQSRHICEEAGLGYLDLEGNCRLAFAGIYIEREAPPSPKTIRKDAAALFTPKSTRVLRALLRDPYRSWKVQDLADAAGVSIGQASNVRKALLDKEWAIPDVEGLKIKDPDDLLDGWRAAYRPPPGETHEYYTPRHGDALTDALRSLADGPGQVVAGGQTAARWLSPYLRSPMEFFYTDRTGLDALSKALLLVPKERGGNVTVTVVKDEGVLLDRIMPVPRLWTTGIVQTYLDLFTMGDRGQEAAEFLRRNKMEWSNRP
jgi:hypothetical protein